MSTARSRVITRTLAATAVVLATGGAATLGAVDPAGATPAPTSQAGRAHPGTQPPVSRGGHDLAPVLGRSARGAVDGRYIVVMQDRAGARTTRTARQVAVSRGGKVLFDYRSALTGFAARLPDRAVRALRHDRNVAYLEVDHRVSIDGDQSGATWGLDRVDQRSLPLSSSYHYDQTGSGVRAYIVDTGVLTTHTEFTGRTATGYSAISGGTTDCNGHGTHVAGTVGGTTYGVAKGVTIVPVRVLDCSGSGTDSGVIAGVDWVTSNHTSGQPAVANMSLGGGASSALDTAVTNAVNDGVVFAVAAGNDNADACNGSPSRVASAVTVGATTSSDARASYSNYGSCLDLFAPGSNITSAWYTSTTATNTISGTSMATPHVTGAAALYLQAHPSASPATVASWLTSNATSGVVTSPGTGSPNRLLYTLEGGGTTPPPTGNLLVNPGFESGATGWSASSGVITNDTGRPARTGSWKAWLCGYGSTHTDTLSQSVTLPSTATTLSFYLRIDTSETTTSTAYDKLSVQVVSGGTTTTLATYSNLNATSSYVQRSFSLAAYAGKTVTIKLTGTEDASLQTSFVVDDTSIG